MGKIIHNKKNQAGFTLIEVLIALTILAIALTGVILTMGQSIRTQGKIRDNLTAHWIAENSNAALQLDLPGTDATRDQTHTATMLKRTWSIHTKPLTQTPTTQTVQIQVYRTDHEKKAKGTPLATINSYLLRSSHTTTQNKPPQG